jgi:hypothetical protein
MLQGIAFNPIGIDYLRLSERDPSEVALKFGECNRISNSDKAGTFKILKLPETSNYNSKVCRKERPPESTCLSSAPPVASSLYCPSCSASDQELGSVLSQIQCGRCPRQFR